MNLIHCNEYATNKLLKKILEEEIPKSPVWAWFKDNKHHKQLKNNAVLVKKIENLDMRRKGLLLRTETKPDYEYGHENEKTYNDYKVNLSEDCREVNKLLNDIEDVAKELP